MKKILFVALSVAALATFADTWSENPWVYQPVSAGRTLSEQTYWAVYDSKGNNATILYNNGVIDQKSLKNAIGSLKLSVNSVFETMAYLAQDIILIDAELVLMDKALEDLSGKLDSTFADVMKRLNELEIKDTSSGKSATLRRTSSTDGKTIYVTERFIGGGVDVDGCSIKTNSSGKIELYNFSLWSGVSGVQPYNDGGSISFDNPWLKCDDTSISVDLNERFRPAKGNNKHGLHLAGWYGPTAGDAACDEYLADRLKDGDETHYILTQKRDSDKHLHYMRIGKIASGQAIRFEGTDGIGVVLGEGAETNSVKFAAASGCNVSATVSGNKSNITITFGVYYQ